MTTSQRRRWDRCRKELDVTVLGGEDGEITCKTLDLCEGGIGLVCSTSLATGRSYRFAIRDVTAEPMPGTVRWCTTSSAHQSFQVGIELDGMSARQTEDLAEAIARWRAEGVRLGDE
jgi:hypothetical protein